MSDNQMTLLNLHETYQKLDEGEVILDVRRQDEFQAGHIPKAINIPLDELGSRSEELKPYKKIYIHCKRGGRAKTAFDSLKGQGFDNIVCVYDAGMDLWIDKEFPVAHD